MTFIIARGLLIPFLGTALGSLCVFFMKKELNQNVQRCLTGFASGVMVSASFWSLLLPAIQYAQNMERYAGKLSFIPAATGFCLGMLFLLLLDTITPHLHLNSENAEGPSSSLKKTTMMVFAVVLHNIPEGMAVGVVYSGWLNGAESAVGTFVSSSAAFALALGIAIQNFPEGAIISMPLHSKGMSKPKAALSGILSGAVEPVAGLVTILLSSLIIPFMPFLLSFAAGAMIYVVVEELIPEMSAGQHSNWGTITFMFGFALMMILDGVL